MNKKIVQDVRASSKVKSYTRFYIDVIQIKKKKSRYKTKNISYSDLLTTKSYKCTSYENGLLSLNILYSGSPCPLD